MVDGDDILGFGIPFEDQDSSTLDQTEPAVSQHILSCTCTTALVTTDKVFPVLNSFGLYVLFVNRSQQTSHIQA